MNTHAPTTHRTDADVEADTATPTVLRSLFRSLVAVIGFVVVFELVLWIDDLITPCEGLGCLWPIIPVVLAAYGLAFFFAPVALGLLAWERWGDADRARDVAAWLPRVVAVTAVFGPLLLVVFG